MKKIYISPALNVFDLHTETAILAYSYGDTETDAVWTNKQEIDTDTQSSFWDTDFENYNSYNN